MPPFQLYEPKAMQNFLSTFSVPALIACLMFAKRTSSSRVTFPLCDGDPTATVSAFSKIIEKMSNRV